MTWCPHATVAAIIERQQRFLMVEERVADDQVFNQPAGHLEPGEDLLAAVVREVREETGHHFVPRALVGVYLWEAPSGISYLRFAFCGPVSPLRPAPRLDPDITAWHWLTYQQLADGSRALRSPLVLRGLDDYRAGRRHRLDLLQQLAP